MAKKKSPADEALAVFSQAVVLHQKGDLEAAIKYYGIAAKIAPPSADLYNNMGVALRSLKRQQAAIVCYHKSIAIKPKNAGAYSNLGNAYRDLGQYEDAVEAHKMSVKLAGGTPESIYNLGLAIRDFGAVEESLSFFDQVIEAQPEHWECRWDRAISLLQMGQYKEGFEEYENRWHLNRTPARLMEAPMWEGGDLEGRTLLLYQEQGFGDMIQFARFAPFVKKRFGGKIIIECQPPLVRLFQSLDGIDAAVPVGAELPEHEYATPLLSLPRILKTTLETLPNKVPYLHAPQPHRMTINAPAHIKFKVGIVWAGKMTPRDRSCPYTSMLDLMEIPGVELFSLQRDERVADIEKFGTTALTPNIGERMNDFADTATVMEQLDLIITIDSAVAHMAGALGRPTWVLLLNSSDWRWLMDRDDSPWYPTMKLFRQKHPGEWDEVFARVKKELKKLLSSIAPR